MTDLTDDADIDTALPIRLRIQDKLVKILSEIDGTGDWKYDLRDSVFRGRVIFGDKDPLPMVSILEVPVPLDQMGSEADNTHNAGKWELMIQGFVKDDKLHPTDPGHYLMADVKKVLAKYKKTDRGFKVLGFVKHVTGIQVGAGVVRPPDEISSKAYFWLSVTLDITENWEEPYEV